MPTDSQGQQKRPRSKRQCPGCREGLDDDDERAWSNCVDCGITVHLRCCPLIGGKGEVCDKCNARIIEQGREQCLQARGLQAAAASNACMYCGANMSSRTECPICWGKVCVNPGCGGPLDGQGCLNLVGAPRNPTKFCASRKCQETVRAWSEKKSHIHSPFDWLPGSGNVQLWGVSVYTSPGGYSFGVFWHPNGRRMECFRSDGHNWATLQGYAAEYNESLPKQCQTPINLNLLTGTIAEVFPVSLHLDKVSSSLLRIDFCMGSSPDTTCGHSKK